MKSYVVVYLNVLDEEKLNQYKEKAAITVKNYNGSFLTKGPVETLGGGTNFRNKAIIEFQSKEDAKNWYNSKEYQKIIPLRDEGMESLFTLV